MNELAAVCAVLLTLVGVGCGPDVADPVSSDSMNASSETTTATTSSSSSSSSSASSSSSDTSGNLDCEGYRPPEEPPWSWQNCSNEPCPEGEVCRYDPGRGCGADPVCVNPTTYACLCEGVDELLTNLACPCPDYVAPPELVDGTAPIECTTRMSPKPITGDRGCLP